jgi:hypothetical protein
MMFCIGLPGPPGLNGPAGFPGAAGLPGVKGLYFYNKLKLK